MTSAPSPRPHPSPRAQTSSHGRRPSLHLRTRGLNASTPRSSFVGPRSRPASTGSGTSSSYTRRRSLVSSNSLFKQRQPVAKQSSLTPLTEESPSTIPSPVSARPGGPEEPGPSSLAMPSSPSRRSSALLLQPSPAPVRRNHRPSGGLDADEAARAALELRQIRPVQLNLKRPIPGSVGSAPSSTVTSQFAHGQPNSRLARRIAARLAYAYQGFGRIPETDTVPDLVKAGFSPSSPPFPATPRTPAYLHYSVGFNAPMLATAWRESNLSSMPFPISHRRNKSSSSSISTTPSTYSSDCPRSPAILPIGKKMGRDSALKRTPSSSGAGSGSPQSEVNSDWEKERPAERPRLSKLDTRSTIRIPNPARVSYNSSSALPRAHTGLGLASVNLSPEVGHHQDITSPSIPSLLPFSPASATATSSASHSNGSSPDLTPLSAALSAGARSPLEDAGLTITERRARRRLGVDFHSHAQLVELFHLAEAEVEPDYIFDARDNKCIGGPDHNIAGCGGVGSGEDFDDESDSEDSDADGTYVLARQSSMSVPRSASPTLTSLLQIVSDEYSIEDEEVELADFSWDAEDPNAPEDDQVLDRSSVELRGQPERIDEDGNPIGIDVEREDDHGRRSPSLSLSSTISDLNVPTTLAAINVYADSPLASLLKDSSGRNNPMSDPYDFPDEEPIPHSPDDQDLLELQLEFYESDVDFDFESEPRSAFSDSESEYGGDDGGRGYRSSWCSSHHSRRRSAGNTSGTLSRKLKALKASMSMASLKQRSRRISQDSGAHPPVPQTHHHRHSPSPSTASAASYQFASSLTSSPPMAPDSHPFPMNALSSSSSSASHSHSNSLSSMASASSAGYDYQSASTTSHSSVVSHSVSACGPPRMPLPPLPANAMLAPPPTYQDVVHIYTPASASPSPEFNTYSMHEVEVDGSKYCTPAPMDPDTSMARLEMSLKKLRVHRPRSRPLSAEPALPSAPVPTKEKMPSSEEPSRDPSSGLEMQIVVGELGELVPPLPEKKKDIPVAVNRQQSPRRATLQIDTSPQVIGEVDLGPVRLEDVGGPVTTVMVGEKLHGNPPSHITQWRFPVQDELPPPVPEKDGLKVVMPLLPRFDFEDQQRPPPMSPAERRSSRQVRRSRQLRRSSSLIDLNDLRQALRLSVSSESSRLSSPTQSNEDAQPLPPLNPVRMSTGIRPLMPSMPSFMLPNPITPKRTTPFLHRTIRSESVTERPARVPMFSSRQRDSETTPTKSLSLRRPSFVTPIKSQIRILSLSRVSEVPTDTESQSPSSDESHRASRGRKFWDRVTHSEKKLRMRSSMATVQ